MNFKIFLQNFVWVCAFLCISYFIGQTTQAGMPWYDTLIKSPYNPPKIMFPIVWTTLYIMLAMVGCYLWRHKQNSFMKNMFIGFCLYMLVNWAWSYIFFYAHYISTGFYWIILSDLILGFLIFRLFKQGYQFLSLSLLPTFIWGCYAAYLNGYIMILN